jgi:hypothetical protein
MSSGIGVVLRKAPHPADLPPGGRGDPRVFRPQRYSSETGRISLSPSVQLSIGGGWPKAGWGLTGV